jgi:hypothetical protein
MTHDLTAEERDLERRLALVRAARAARDMRQKLAQELAAAEGPEQAADLLPRFAESVIREKTVSDRLKAPEPPGEKPAVRVNREPVAVKPFGPITPEVRQARLDGYDGKPCPKCGSLRIVSSGLNWACSECGAHDKSDPPPAQEPPQDVAALGLTPAQVEAAACAAVLGCQWPPTVRPVQIGADLWLNVSESWSGDEPRLITACLQRIVPRYLWDGPEPTAKTVYPPAGERLSYRGRLVLVNGAEYVMLGEDGERKVTWTREPTPAPEPAPAKERKPRKPRTPKQTGTESPQSPQDASKSLPETSKSPRQAPKSLLGAESSQTPNPPGVTFADGATLVKVAPGCVLAVRPDEEGGAWWATPPDGRPFGNWGDDTAGKLAPCETEIARAVGEALGEDVEFVGYVQERGRPAFRLRRRAGGAEGGLLFPETSPTAHEGGL